MNELAASEGVARSFGPLNWLVLTAYLAILVGIGYRCSRSIRNTEGFFLGGRNIPWWAAGLSLFSTMLSAITYLAVPARAFATDWTLLLVNLCVLAVAPVIIFKYLPEFRRHRITTIYEFLGRRFNPSVQKFGSASFVLFQLGRMGIVLLLPALALSAVTGMNLYLCIALMGTLATIYTATGGIEAVVWTDVIQTVVLLGGALLALFIISDSLEHGLGDIIRIGREAEKFHWVNLNAHLVEGSLSVVLLGGLFSNALVPYSSDQAVVQRYLSTKDEASARRTMWLGAAMVVPATLVFLFLGTALFAYFHAHPDALIPLKSNDQILPWFIASQMPAGLAGLVIAGVFAAAMSSLDSSMHSISTSVVIDWLRPLAPHRTDTEWLSTAKRVTVVAGTFGTVSALLLAGVEIRFLWDFFLGLIGLIGGTLAGVVTTAVFLPRASTMAVWIGIFVALTALIFARFFTELPGLLYGFIGVASVVVTAGIFPRVSTAKKPA